ncbi:MAG: S41 family peptidase [Solirubrobacterales bacterium]
MSTATPGGGFASGVAVGLVLGLAAAALLGILTGALEGDPGAAEQARDVIEANYFEPVDEGELDQASVAGMVTELRRRHDDRFSHYFSPEQLEVFEAATSGEFSGVGLTVNEVRRGLRVASVLPDTPAEQAGITGGDLITAVDGDSIAGVPSNVSTARIKGPPGTEVELRVEPAGGGRPREVTVERARVRVPAVQGGIRRAGGREVAYVDFETFSDGAHGELRETIERLLRRGAEGVVLDLRGNGGGLLNEAILSTSVFVEDGVIVSTSSRAQGERDYDAVGDALEPRPTVVLINRDTASAAEILAAALETYDLATIVGAESFGKGTFQEVIGLESGGALDLTVGEYLTADGASLAGDGIAPEVRAEDDPETRRDEGLDEALRVLAGELEG